MFNSVQECLVQEHLFLQKASGGCFFNSKNFARFPLTVIDKFFSSSMYISLFYGDNFFCVWLNLKDIIYFSLIFTWVLQRKEVTLRKSSLLCKSSSKSAPKCRVFPFQMIKLSRLVNLQRMSFSHFYTRFCYF